MGGSYKQIGNADIRLQFKVISWLATTSTAVSLTLASLATSTPWVEGRTQAGSVHNVRLQVETRFRCDVRAGHLLWLKTSTWHGVYVFCSVNQANLD